MLQYRRILVPLCEDLKKKMVILAGPRQCGKTTLAKSVGGQVAKNDFTYLNWDRAEDRKSLLNDSFYPPAKLLILDEIHKYRRWRNWLKGLFDHYRDDHQFLITGSAKLELYGRGGDSLQGRYFPYHLHPLTLSEVEKIPFDASSFLDLPETPTPHAEGTLNDLLALGGFPEPFFSGSLTAAKRWRFGYGRLLIDEDVRSLELIKELTHLELLYDQLPQTVGSLLSINSLREDLEVGFATAKNWIEILERLYSVFRIYPYGPPKIKAIKREGKLYCWDWARVEDEASRVENLVALHLLRLAHWYQDFLGENVEVRFFRSPQERELDFVVLKNKKPWFAVEVKSGERELSRGLRYFLERVKLPYAFQISLRQPKDAKLAPINGCKIRVTSICRFLCNLP